LARTLPPPLLVTAGDNPHRLHHERAFAALCGVNPVPVNSGKKQNRHRISRGGDRQANGALWRIAIVLDNFSPHLSTKTDTRVGDWAAANNVELAYVPFYGSWLNRIEASYTALR
jgi:hypothetical protein